jgi:hypothetical protein
MSLLYHATAGFASPICLLVNYSLCIASNRKVAVVVEVVMDRGAHSAVAQREDASFSRADSIGQSAHGESHKLLSRVMIFAAAS